MSQLPDPLKDKNSQDLLLQTVLNSIDDAVVVFDDQQTIVYANPATTKVFGKSLEQLTGNHISHLIPEDRRKAFEHTATTLKNSEHHFVELTGEHEFVGLRVNQQIFYAHGRLTKLPHEQATLYILVLQDITWRKTLEDALEKALLRSQELEGKAKEHLEHPSILDEFPPD